MERGQKLCALRKLKGYSQEYVAMRLGVSERTIYRIEHGADSKLSVFMGYCKLLGLTHDQLDSLDLGSILPGGQ